MRVPSTAIIECFVEMRLIIVDNTRCCSTHIVNGKFNEVDFKKIKIFHDTADLDENQIRHMLLALGNEVKVLRKRIR